MNHLAYGILLVLIPTAYSLKCYTCKDSISCRSGEMACPSSHNETCMTLRIGSDIGKSCSRKKDCNDSCKGHSDCHVVCCSSDLCNSCLQLKAALLVVALVFFFGCFM